jgi:hypothetical protein
MGEAVNVGVMVDAWVTVAVPVGGSGVDVMVAAEVGAAKIPIPHPDNKIDSPIIKTNIFFM